MFIISGQFKVKEAFKAQLIEQALALIPLSESEQGCISYGFYEDQKTPGNFLFFERWKSREAIAEHFNKSYFTDFAGRFPAMIEGDAVIEIHEIKKMETV